MSKASNNSAGGKPAGRNGQRGEGKPAVLITRKIQLLLEADGREQWRQQYQQLRDWQQIVTRAANWIATHHYVQENLKDLFYLVDGARIKLADAKKDPEGILTASRLSTTYQLLSGKLKGSIPMAIISSLNNRIVSVFDKEKGEYREGRRSLRTYKQDLPVPIVHSDILHVRPDGKGDYIFQLYGLLFRTHFGRDASGNRVLFEQALVAEVEPDGVKLCNSSLSIGDNKIFLLAVFSMPPVDLGLSPERRVEARLSVETAVVATCGEAVLRIGSAGEYLHRRLAIQGSMHREQANLRFSKGGKGRKRKMKGLKRFHDLEKNYVNTRLHQYSARLIAFCREQGAGILVLKDQEKGEMKAREEPFLLRNWGYYNLREKIRYKAAKYGIQVLIG